MAPRGKDLMELLPSPPVKDSACCPNYNPTLKQS